MIFTLTALYVPSSCTLYQYSNVRYFTTSIFPRFFLSASHRSTHFAILPLDVSLPTLTVAIIRAQSNDSAKHVSSKNELCSEYGTPYTCKVAVELRIGCRFACVNVRLCEREMTFGMDGSVSVPLGAVNLRTNMSPLHLASNICEERTSSR